MSRKNSKDITIIKKNRLLKKSITSIAILLLISKSTTFGNTKNIGNNGVGTWVQQDMLASSGDGDYTSNTSVTYYHFNGTVCVTDGGAVGSGIVWSYTNAAIAMQRVENIQLKLLLKTYSPIDHKQHQYLYLYFCVHWQLLYASINSQ